MSDPRDEDDEPRPAAPEPLPDEPEAEAPEPEALEPELFPDPVAVASGPKFALRREVDSAPEPEPFEPELPIEPDSAPIQRTAPLEWSTPRVRPEPVEPPPPPERPSYPGPIVVQRKRRPLAVRIGLWVAKAVIIFILGSVLWVAAYRFINPPSTLTMIGDMIGGNGATQRWMALRDIDPSMARAAIAAEDSRFCGHSGFDFEAIEAAYERNATGRKRIRGGSTISQQTAKNVFLWQGGGYFRKGLEAWFTVLIEAIWGKKRIMEVYLNVAETGIGTYGVNAGSQRYFGHDASRMSPQEAARIAAVLPLPKKRAGSDPRGFTLRYGKAIQSRIGVVQSDALDACVR